MSNKIKKFDVGGPAGYTGPSITTTAPGPSRMGDSTFPDFFLSPLDVNDIFQTDVDYMDMLEAAGDEELFRMLGVNSSVPTPEFPTKKEIQEYAAQKYVDAVAEYMQSTGSMTQSEAKQAIEDAKRLLVDLDVPRSTIESATNDYFQEGIDTSRGIPGVMGPSIGGAISQGIEKGSELFGMGAEGLASLVGADKALSSALLNLPNLGVTFVFDESGRKTPIITGQTPSGTQVGVNVNDPYGITDIIEGMRTGDLDIYDVIGAGGRVITGTSKATSLADDDKTKKTGVETGVNVDLGKQDTDKIPAGDAGLPKDKGAGAGAVSTRIIGEGLGGGEVSDRVPVDKGAGAGAVSTRIIGEGLGGGEVSDRVPVDKVPTLDLPSFPTTKVPALTLPDFPTLSLPSDRTLTLPDFDPLEPERIPTSTTTPADKVPADKIPGGEGGGGLGLPEETATPTGGMRGVATEQAGVAEIAMLYDPSLSLAENMARILGKKKSEQADAVDSVLMYGGGIVQPTDLNAEIRKIIEGR